MAVSRIRLVRICWLTSGKLFLAERQSTVVVRLLTVPEEVRTRLVSIICRNIIPPGVRRPAFSQEIVSKMLYELDDRSHAALLWQAEQLPEKLKLERQERKQRAQSARKAAMWLGYQDTRAPR